MEGSCSRKIPLCANEDFQQRMITRVGSLLQPSTRYEAIWEKVNLRNFNQYFQLLFKMWSKKNFWQSVERKVNKKICLKNNYFLCLLPEVKLSKIIKWITYITGVNTKGWAAVVLQFYVY